MTKYYMSLETIVEVESENEIDRYEEAKHLYIQLLTSGFPVGIVVVDTDDSDDVD